MDKMCGFRGSVTRRPCKAARYQRRCRAIVPAMTAQGPTRRKNEKAAHGEAVIQDVDAFGKEIGGAERDRTADLVNDIKAMGGPSRLERADDAYAVAQWLSPWWHIKATETEHHSVQSAAFTAHFPLFGASAK